MMQVWREWDNATPDEKEMYQHYLDEALFSNIRLPSGGTRRELQDDPSPSSGGATQTGATKPTGAFTETIATKPTGAFTETMLRWTRSTFGSDLLLVEPAAPQPTDA
jgi:hypothetical protein